jgi:hypothetical protein
MTTTDRSSMELEGHTLAFLKALEAQGHLTHMRAEKCNQRKHLIELTNLHLHTQRSTT